MHPGARIVRQKEAAPLGRGGLLQPEARNAAEAIGETAAYFELAKASMQPKIERDSGKAGDGAIQPSQE
jgi:hypothetical protein